MAKALTVRTFPRASSATPVALDTYQQNQINSRSIHLEEPKFSLDHHIALNVC